MANDRFSKKEAIKFGWEAAAIPTIRVAHAYVYRKPAYGATTEQPVTVSREPEAAAPPEA